MRAFSVWEGVDMRTDFENIQDGDRVQLYPNATNPIHNKSTRATYQSGYYYCDDTNPADGPDYYFRDVAVYNEGFELLTELAKGGDNEQD